MDFEESPEETAFRAEVREWLAARAKRRQPGTDPEHFYSSSDSSAEADAAHVRACKAWQRTLYDAGWAGIAWPKEFGGRGGAGWQQRIFNEEQSRFDVAAGVFAVGIAMAGPTIIAWGTEDQQQRFLTPMLSGEHVWCQLFSEPGAGSDLAGLRTRAVRDGEQWVVNGQKVWTSGAHHSDWGLLLARTDLDAPKHKGITAFLLDMRTPGIEVRPLRQINGMAHFNEVFFTDVAIPDACRLGPVNEGWRVANTMLSNERAMIGGGGRVGPHPATPADHGPLVREHRVRDPPTLVDRTEPARVGNRDIGEEDLVEVRHPVDLTQRPHLDSRRTHVEQE